MDDNIYSINTIIVLLILLVSLIVLTSQTYVIVDKSKNINFDVNYYCNTTLPECNCDHGPSPCLSCAN